MRWWNKAPAPFTYPLLLEIATTAHVNAWPRRYRDGVVAAAVDAAHKAAPDRKRQIDTLVATFESYEDRFPHWDGSIA